MAHPPLQGNAAQRVDDPIQPQEWCFGIDLEPRGHLWAGARDLHALRGGAHEHSVLLGQHCNSVRAPQFGTIKASKARSRQRDLLQQEGTFVVANLQTSNDGLRCFKLQTLLFLRAGEATPCAHKLNREGDGRAILGAKVVKGKPHIRSMVTHVSSAALAARNQPLVFQRLQSLAQCSKTYPELIRQFQLAGQRRPRFENSACDLLCKMVAYLDVKGSCRNLFCKRHVSPRGRSKSGSSPVQAAIASTVHLYDRATSPDC